MEEGTELLTRLKKALVEKENVPLPMFTSCSPGWIKVAVSHGLGNARKLLNSIQAGTSNYHFVEVMTCPGGCIGGGGQPRFTTDEVRQKRIEAIYKEDEGKEMRKSHENPEIKQIYEEYLKEPLGEKSHHLLHTHYESRDLH